MKCCVEDCPHHCPTANEIELCRACDKELALAHLADSVAAIDDAIQATEWRFCVETLTAMDRNNQVLHRVSTLFETLERTRSELKFLCGDPA
ncbi:MAG: hypothetical protein R3C59_03770 [Planctomycetaceae bacterium]